MQIQRFLSSFVDPRIQEIIDFRQTRHWIRTFVQDQELCLDHETDSKNLVPGFAQYSMDNCKMSRIQRGVNYFYGCNLLTIPVHCNEYVMVATVPSRIRVSFRAKVSFRFFFSPSPQASLLQPAGVRDVLRGLPEA